MNVLSSVASSRLRRSMNSPQNLQSHSNGTFSTATLVLPPRLSRTGGNIFLPALLFTIALLTGCGGSSNKIALGGISFPGSTGAVTTMVTGSAQALSATVANDSRNLGVDWSVSCASTQSGACGTILPAHSANGAITTFTAPALPPTGASVIITATASANPSSTVTVTITIAATPISVAVSPTAANLNTVLGGAAPQALFTAVVSNDTANAGVNWTLSCGVATAGACGAVDLLQTLSGVQTTYTAPTGALPPPTVTLTATSVTDPTKSASAAITLNPPAPIAIAFSSPPPASMQEGATAQLIATLANDPSADSIKWSASAGTFSLPATASGQATAYTAPATAGTVTITATSSVDPTKSVTANINITVPVISVTVAPVTANVPVGGTEAITATVANDNANAGVAWAISCADGGAACGSFTSTTTTAANYQAPAAQPTGAVTITATSIADQTKSATSTLTITPASVNTLAPLNGHYVFALTGESLSGADVANNYAVMGGTLVADGNGGISGGEADRGDNLVSTAYSNLSGTYTLDASGQGTVTLNAFTAAGGTTTPVATYIFSISMVNANSGTGQAQLSEIDTQGTLQGMLMQQDTASLAAPPNAGNYNYFFNGPTIAPGSWEAVAGVATLTSPTRLNSFLYDDFAGNNSYSTHQTAGYGGRLPASLDSYGRASFSAAPGQFLGVNQNGRAPWAYYQIDAGHYLLVSTDQGAPFSVPALLSFAAQPATLPTSLAGAYAFTLSGGEKQAANPFALAPAAIGGVFTCDANGNLTGMTLDSNDQTGFQTLTQTTNGTCALDSPATGRGTISFSLPIAPVFLPNQFIFYQTSAGLYLLGGSGSGGANAYGGPAYLQGAGASAATFTGTYAGSILSYNQVTTTAGATTYNGLDLLQGQFTASGVAAITGTVDVNAHANNNQGKVTTATTLTDATGFTDAGNGRLTGGAIGTSSTPAISTTQNIYIVDANTALSFETDPSVVGTGILQLPRLSSSGNPIGIAFSATPPVSVQVGGTLQVAVALTNDSANKGATWSASAGTFSAAQTASGVATTYTAPGNVPTGGTITITATSVADATRNVTATLQVTAAVQPIAVAIVSPPASLQTGATGSFTATVSNDTANGGVTWSATAGSFSPTQTASGIATTYTAPATVPAGGTVTITATSVTDTTKTATAVVQVTAPVVPITVAITAAPASLQAGATGSFTATVSNDTANGGVTWSAAEGTFSPTHTAGGVASTYTAPGSVPTGGTVTITATSVTDPSKSATATVTITAPVNTAAWLNGHYIFALTGESLSGADIANNYAVMGGTLVADGNGGISGGEADRGDNLVSTAYTSLSGTYKLDTSGQGKLTLNAFTDAGGTTTPAATYTFSISMVNANSGTGQAQLTEIDAQGTLQGTLVQQDTASLAAPPNAGNYNYFFNGPTVAPGSWEAVAGVATLTSPTRLSSFLYDDFAGNSSYSTDQTAGYGGRLPASLDSYGRASFSAAAGSFFGASQNGRASWAYYQIDAGHYLLVSTDQGAPFSVPALLSFAAQPATLPTSLAGAYAFTLTGGETQAANSFALAPAAIGGVFTCDASGNLTSMTLDSNDQTGPQTLTQTTNGTCALDSPATGRGTISFSLPIAPAFLPTQFIFYQTSAGLYLLGGSGSGGANAYGGLAYLQGAGVSAATFTGNYAGSILSYNQVTAGGTTTYNGLDLLQGQFTASGAAALTGTVDANAHANNGGTFTTAATTLTDTTGFTDSGNGRLTGGVLSTAGAVTTTTTQNIYIVDANTALTFETDSSAGTGVLRVPTIPAQP